MGALIAGTFFTDKVRGFVTVFFMVSVVVILGMSYFFPKTSGLDDKTMDALQDVTTSLNRAVTNLETSAQSQAMLNETLQKQIDVADAARKKGYEDLINLYPLDPVVPDGGVTLSNGLLPQNNHLGGKPVPPGTSSASANKLLQNTAPEHKSTPDGGHPTGKEPKP